MDRELNLIEICQVNRKIIQNEKINFCLFWLKTLNICEFGIKNALCTHGLLLGSMIWQGDTHTNCHLADSTPLTPSEMGNLSSLQGRYNYVT